MMYPRLSLFRGFLTEDGEIFIIIDGNEVHAADFMFQLTREEFRDLRIQSEQAGNGV